MKKTSEPKKIGRPTIFTNELASLICDRIATHGIGLQKLCLMYDDMPAKITINQWRHKYPDFSAQYAQAKISQIEVLIDEIIEIADNCSQDNIINEQSHTVCNTESIARDRLRIDTRKWLAAKLVPKTYGILQKNEPLTGSSFLEKLLELN